MHRALDRDVLAVFEPAADFRVAGIVDELLFRRRGYENWDGDLGERLWFCEGCEDIKRRAEPAPGDRTEFEVRRCIDERDGKASMAGR